MGSPGRQYVRIESCKGIPSYSIIESSTKSFLIKVLLGQRVHLQWKPIQDCLDPL